MKLRLPNPASLFCLLLALAPDGAAAQGLTNTIPPEQQPLARIWAPAPAEMTPPGTGKFVLFTREKVGPANEWDFIAGAWECIPSQPGHPVTKRVEFCHSSWNAGTLLNTLVQDGSDGLFPRFVRLQVDSGDREHRVNLYDVNYRTWNVRILKQTKRLSAFGVLDDHIFCKTGQEWLLVNTMDGSIIPKVPFEPVDVDGSFWLVRKPGDKDGLWSYDPRTKHFPARFGPWDSGASRNSGHSQACLSPDGQSRARFIVPMPPGDWGGGRVPGTLMLQRGSRQPRRIISSPVEVEAIEGSGRPVIPTHTRLAFNASGALEFQSKLGNESVTWTVAPASETVTITRLPYARMAEPPVKRFDGVPVPEWLPEDLKELWHFGRGGLAPAFLLHLGILKEKPKYPDCVTGVSPDGRHVFFAAKKGPLADEILYGDLRTKQVIRWKRPEGIDPGDSMDAVWVESP